MAFASSFSHSDATVKPAPFLRRMPNLTSFDPRTERRSTSVECAPWVLRRVQHFNTNAVPPLTTTADVSWLRPTATTGPRILRVGARWKW